MSRVAILNAIKLHSTIVTHMLRRDVNCIIIIIIIIINIDV